MTAGVSKINRCFLRHRDRRVERARAGLLWLEAMASRASRRQLEDQLSVLNKNFTALHAEVTKRSAEVLDAQRDAKRADTARVQLELRVQERDAHIASLKSQHERESRELQSLFDLLNETWDQKKVNISV